MTLMAVMVISFAATTLDTATRIQRFIITELGRSLRIRPLANRYFATLLANDPRFKTSESRIAHVEEIDAIVGGWIAMHDLDDVLRQFGEAEAAIAPVYDIAQIFDDPQYRARQDIISVPDSELGSVRMQNVFPFMSRTPGEVRFAGAKLGEHNQEILGGEIGLGDGEIAHLKEIGAV